MAQTCIVHGFGGSCYIHSVWFTNIIRYSTWTCWLNPCHGCSCRFIHPICGCLLVLSCQDMTILVEDWRLLLNLMQTKVCHDHVPPPFNSLWLISRWLRCFRSTCPTFVTCQMFGIRSCGAWHHLQPTETMLSWMYPLTFGTWKNPFEKHPRNRCIYAYTSAFPGHVWNVFGYGWMRRFAQVPIFEHVKIVHFSW